MLLNAILAAGNSASNKRSGLKRFDHRIRRFSPINDCEYFRPRERSKSVITDDISLLNRNKDLREPCDSQYRRQSTFSEGKAKISKWTKVKAAFKWERANVPVLPDQKNLSDTTSNTGLTPLNHEIARLVRRL